MEILSTQTDYSLFYCDKIWKYKKDSMHLCEFRDYVSFPFYCKTLFIALLNLLSNTRKQIHILIKHSNQRDMISLRFLNYEKNHFDWFETRPNRIYQMYLYIVNYIGINWSTKELGRIIKLLFEYYLGKSSRFAWNLSGNIGFFSNNYFFVYLNCQFKRNISLSLSLSLLL